jgi:catalase
VYPPPRPERRSPLLALAAIAAIVGAIALAFAWTAGWIGGGRLTAQRIVDALEDGDPHAFPGYRRAHAKGVCVTGTFQGTSEAARLSIARVFTQPEVPVTGRLSIAGANPHGADDGARVRSIGLLLATDDGRQWRTAMNEFPMFPTATPEGFLALMEANRPDPATGRPDPARMEAFVARYPEIRRFQAWAGQAPFTDSWASTTFNGVNAFRLRAPDGSERAVRWSLRPHEQPQNLTREELTAAGSDFLAREFRQRLASGPVNWDLVLVLAGPGDAVNDPSQPWPDSREQVVAGVLTLNAAEPQATGACRDINFDPLTLPDGIAPSDDPVLLARGAVYSESFNRREIEIARGRATEAAGKAGAE